MVCLFTGHKHLSRHATLLGEAESELYVVFAKRTMRQESTSSATVQHLPALARDSWATLSLTALPSVECPSTESGASSH
jgi:hypothetical protein